VHGGRRHCAVTVSVDENIDIEVLDVGDWIRK
jgi:hypothetical protein